VSGVASEVGVFEGISSNMFVMLADFAASRFLLLVFANRV
jgi:hypothetical protein